MADGVVDELEVVEVDDEQRAAATVAARAAHGRVELLDEAPPAEQPGQRVVVDELAQPPLVVLGLGDVVDGPGDEAGAAVVVALDAQADLERALLAVRAHDAELDRLGRGRAPRLGQPRLVAGAVLGVDEAPDPVAVAGAVGGVDAEDAEDLRGPDALAVVEAALEGAHAGEGLGLEEPGLAAPQRGLGQAVLRDVLGDAARPHDRAGGVAHRLGDRVEPVDGAVGAEGAQVVLDGLARDEQALRHPRDELAVLGVDERRHLVGQVAGERGHAGQAAEVVGPRDPPRGGVERPGPHPAERPRLGQLGLDAVGLAAGRGQALLRRRHAPAVLGGVEQRAPDGLAVGPPAHQDVVGAGGRRTHAVRGEQHEGRVPGARPQTGQRGGRPVGRGGRVEQHAVVRRGGQGGLGGGQAGHAGQRERVAPGVAEHGGDQGRVLGRILDEQDPEARGRGRRLLPIRRLGVHRRRLGLEP